MPRLPGFRRSPDSESAPVQPPPTPRVVRRALPPAGQLRRERRALLQLREGRLRDLGGLILEMYRRDQFRQDLLVDTLLAASVSRGRARPAARCECGAAVFWGAKFCGQCGRPLGAPAARSEGAS
jgi:uncharacterized protein YjiS (DUF1127 family)